MFPIIGSDDNQRHMQDSSGESSPMLSSSPPSLSSSPITSSISPLKFRLERGSDVKFNFGFFKKRLSPSPSTSSVRPKPEEVAKWSNSFYDLMNSKYGQSLFKAFLQLEFNEEHIEFWLLIEDYRKIKNQVKLTNKAQKILNEFILPQSPKEINIDSRTRTQLISQLLNETPTHSTFDEAQKRIQALLEADAYQRFLKSDLYLELLYPE